MRLLTIISILMFSPRIYAQLYLPYAKLIATAEDCYEKKQYREAAHLYSNAFQLDDKINKPNDLYNAACCWALIHEKDSAFSLLTRAASRSKYSNYDHLVRDEDLNILHDDARWTNLCDAVRENKERKEATTNKPIKLMLDTIFMEDQQYRVKLNEAQNKINANPDEIEALIAKINRQDAINLIKITALLDNYGWLGSDVVSDKGVMAIFLVIQHADSATQERYYPIFEKATKEGKLDLSHFALLQDRVLLRRGQKQVYGSQIFFNKATSKYYVAPLADPENVDERRAQAGLPLMSRYVQQWNIKWDPAEYKRFIESMVK